MPDIATRRRADFVEDIFAGLLAAVYNFIATTLLVMRNPIRGAWILARRRARVTIAQLAPQTVIFVVFFAMDLLHYRGASELTPFMRQVVLDRNTPIEVSRLVAKSLCETIFVDWGTFCVAWVARRNTQLSRRRLHLALLYSCAGGLAYFSIGSVLLARIPSGHNVDVVVTWLILILISLPPALLALRAARGLRFGRSRFQPLVATVCMMVVVVAASTAGEVAEDALTENWKSPPIPNVFCRLNITSGSAEITLVIHNPSDETLVYEPDGFRVRVTCPPAGTVWLSGRATAASSGVGSPIYLVAAHSTEWLQLRTNTSGELARASANARSRLSECTCMVEGFGNGSFEVPATMSYVAAQEENLP